MMVFKAPLGSLVDLLLFSGVEGILSTILLANLLNGILFVCQTIQLFY